MNFRNRLIALNKQMQGDFLQMYERLKKDQSLHEYSMYDDMIIKENVVTIIDENYPKRFKLLNRPPFVVYYEGDLSIIDQQTLGIVGSRTPSTYAQTACAELMKQLPVSYTLLTSLDVGISAIAIQTYQTRGPIVGILASGLDRKYPLETKDIFRQTTQSSCLITEYPPKVCVSPKNLQHRLRLLVELSDEMMCIEPLKGSDTKKAGLQALNLGTNVYVLPDQLTSKTEVATFELIEMGAFCLTRFDYFSENET